MTTHKKSQRREDLIERGLKHAKVTGFHNLNAKSICAEENVSHTMIFHYFDTMDGYRDAVAKAAVEAEALPVIAQALAVKNDVARAAPRTLKERAVATLLA